MENDQIIGQVKITLFLLLILLITTPANAQRLKASNRGIICFQTITIKNEKEIRCYRREGPWGGTYGSWVETYPIPHALMTKDKDNSAKLKRDFPHLKIQCGLATNPNNGEQYWQYAYTYKAWRARDTHKLAEYGLPEIVGTSSYYNFSGDPSYDWRTFGGISYGTFSDREVEIERDMKPTKVIYECRCEIDCCSEICCTPRRPLLNAIRNIFCRQHSCTMP